MIIEKIATGKTTEEAIANAKAALNAPAKFELDVHTEILEYPRKKILGLFGGADAKARAYYDDGVTEKAPKKEKKAKPQKEQQPKAKKAPAKQESKPARKAERLQGAKPNCPSSRSYMALVVIWPSS